MRLGKGLATVVIVFLAIVAFIFLFLRSRPISVSDNSNTSEQTERTDLATIRSFTGNPNLELTFVNTDLPMPYFRVGKVTQMDGGENMEAVEGWTRKVNVYNSKELINGKCSVYEYHTDERSHALTAVLMRGLRPSEIEDLNKNNITCISDSKDMPKITKAEAETIAMEHLTRALPNYEQIKNELIYSQQLSGESHEWRWEDKDYKLPEGLSARPYSYPIIRISVYGDGEFQYWNTTPFFNN